MFPQAIKQQTWPGHPTALLHSELTNQLTPHQLWARSSRVRAGAQPDLSWGLPLEMISASAQAAISGICSGRWLRLQFIALHNYPHYDWNDCQYLEFFTNIMAGMRLSSWWWGEGTRYSLWRLCLHLRLFSQRTFQRPHPSLSFAECKPRIVLYCVVIGRSFSLCNASITAVSFLSPYRSKDSLPSRGNVNSVINLNVSFG